jgi:hypothetical protein
MSRAITNKYFGLKASLKQPALKTGDYQGVRQLATNISTSYLKTPIVLSGLSEFFNPYSDNQTRIIYPESAGQPRYIPLYPFPWGIPTQPNWVI